MRVVLLLLAALALAPASASALPGDQPIVPISPADGAVVAPSGGGSTFVYTCPVYRSFDAGGGFAVFNGPSEYFAALATSPDLGTDGRLREDRRVDFDSAQQPNTIPEGQCASTLGNESASGLDPGTYYWQVSRICSGCTGDYETSPIRRIVVRGDVKPSVRAATKVYGGYLAAYRISAPGAPNGVVARLERRKGGGWKRLGTTRLSEEKGEVITVLPKGRQVLRAVVLLGRQRFTSKRTAVRARPDTGPRVTSRRSDGRWKGIGKRRVSFRVSGGGRVIKRFQASVTTLCPTPGMVGGPFTTMAAVAPFGRARIAPDGRFFGVIARDGTAALVRGRLVGRKLRGGVADLTVGTCSGRLSFRARRAGG